MEIPVKTMVEQCERRLGGLRLRRDVQDLGMIDARLEGILSPGYSECEIGNHIHGVFLEHADQYLSFCPINRTLIDHWKELIRTAIGAEAAIDGRRIIDIGSGGGTTVFPMLELLPRSQIFATDLSLPLLAQMRNLARRDGYDRLAILQMNAEDMVFADQQADIVMGAHVLHHALSLGQVFREIRRVLRPNGMAVFWEPFEDGAQILANLFDLWMEMDRYQAEHISSGLIQAMLAFSGDLDRRKGRIKPPEVLVTLDDKWYFTKQFIKDLAAEAGFARCEIHNIYGSYNVVWNMADHELRRWGYGVQVVPQWARDKLLAVQARMSDDYLNAHSFSASIVMRP
jgi:ubiquinone/menaquinone biosynthesis C-methylase UbiE